MARPLRILRLSPVLDFGGVESKFVLQSRSWINDDIDITYCCFWKDGAAANQIRHQGKNVVVLHQNPSVRNPRATNALLRHLREQRYDIVHAAIGEANFHAMLCAKLGPWRTMIEEAGIPHRTLRNRLVHAGLYRLPHAIVCVSQAAADNIIHNEWAPQNKIHVILDAIDDRNFIPPSQRSPDLKLFRAVGRLTAVKNFDGLIHAFATALKSTPDIKLEIIGEGEERPTLEDLIRHYDIAHAVTLPGFHPNIPELHKTTGWLLVPSHREGFGMVAAEAMAAGVPVIASNVGGLPEVFGKLRDRYILAPNNQENWTRRIIEAATTSRLDYNVIPDQMRENAERFHPIRYVGELAQLYHDTEI